MAAVALAISGGGGLSSLETTVLLTVDETLEALRKVEQIHIPPDLHREKQAELNRELPDAEHALAKAEQSLGKPERGLRLARQLISDSAAAYRSVADTTRRQWNQVFLPPAPH